MRSVRRAYTYAIALVGLEALIWGATGLLRTLTHLGNLPGGNDLIARGLSLTLVGLPVFLIHWRMAQRDARRDPEEASSRLRAAFLYAGLLVSLVPIVQNGLSLVDHLFFTLFNLEATQTLLGQGQTWSDNLIAMAINGGVALYLYSVLFADWRRPDTEERREYLAETRRLYRYLWMIYSLGLTVVGVQQLVRFICSTPGEVGGSPSAALANGLALLVTGVPLWVWTLQRTDELLLEPVERESLLRWVALYLLALIGVGAVLSSGGLALAAVLRSLFGGAVTPNELIGQVGNSLSVAIPLGGVWAYYGHRLSQEVKGIAETPRKAALRRLYSYILAFFGLAAVIFGMRNLLGFAVQTLLGNGLANQLADGMASLVVGLPLWALTWGPMQDEAKLPTDSGEHARRSIIRKTYLYGILFAGVALTMLAVAGLLYSLFNGLFGNRPADFIPHTADLFGVVLLVLFWTLLHQRALRQDGKKEEKTLAARQAAFPTILIERDDSTFGEDVVGALRRTAPLIPIIVQKVSQGAPGDEMSGARAVVLPAGLAAQPPEALRIWLMNFSGLRLVVPEVVENWHWLGALPGNRSEQGSQVALALRQMAEGQPVRLTKPANPWMVIGTIFAILFGLEVLFVGLMVAFGGF